jgi:hypothetical protein
MKVINAFKRFAQRVLSAVKKGGLPKLDQVKLGHLLDKTGKRNLILAQAILSSFEKNNKKDIKRFAALLESADSRILKNKEPFTKKERAEITALFRRASLSAKSSRRFTQNIDELLAEQINENIKRKKAVSVAVPKRKTIHLKSKRGKRILRT